MDYIGNKCPVCDRYFHADDDVVVCPDCGTPHHRACYESLGHCHNADRHKLGYDYNEDDARQSDRSKTLCRQCGKENDADAFFCKYCAAELKKDDNSPFTRKHDAQTGYGQNVGNTVPFPFMDPLAGVPADKDFGDGVTAGEAAKYVKQNTPYYVRVFDSIRSFNRSKFSFAAALFSGGFLLYRKMYKIGAVITAVQLALMIVSVAIRISFSSLFTEFINQYYSAASSAGFWEYFTTLDASQLLILYLPVFISIINFVIMIVIGTSFNRLYFNHCRAQIIRIKSETPDGENPETVLQTKGGVNIPLAVSLLVTYLIISYLPGFVTALL